MKKINLSFFENISVFVMILFVIAFRDYTNASVITQLLAFFIVIFMEVILRKKIKSGIIKYTIYKGLFILFSALSILWAVNISTVKPMCFSMILRLINGITILLYIKDERNRNNFLKYTIISGYILCIRMLIVVPRNAWGNERVGIYLSHNIENSYNFTGITFALGTLSALVISDYSIFKNKYMKYFTTIVFTIFSLLSGSKKQIFISLVSIVVLTFFNSKQLKKLIMNIFKMSILLILFIFLILKVDIFYNVIGNRFLSFMNVFFDTSVAIDSSTISRQNYLMEGLNVFYKNPLVGVGINGFRYVNTYAKVWAENNFVEILADLGIIGFCLYYILHLNIIIDIKKRIKYKTKEDVQILLMLICLLFIDSSMVSYGNSMLQFYLAYLFALNELEKKKKVENYVEGNK